ncbi:hypothetical protein H0G86_009620 [Trichoderma simmonsii]|uniref:Uncharacterized protein n=1 Tax=Trichoderma simmonsii TaxID=1491479 RepID=A0A8G0LIF6_9HYPO|nr:hypothetical protein H0G86_009620 [Trichoderma simmonsii]
MDMPRWPKQFLIFCLIPLVQAYHVFNTNCSAPSTLSNYVSSPNTRGTLDILWSSLFTILACTWTLQHPNIPEQRDGRDPGLLGDIQWGLKGFYRSTLRMFWAIIAPELIINDACRDLMCALEDHRKMQDDQGLWTLTHCFYANMGGFAIRDRAKSSEEAKDHGLNYLSSRWIRVLLERNCIDKLPDITEAEIKDKSKGDMFVKIIAVGQILWSIIQIIGRAVRKLPVSPLEVAVVAYAVCAVIIYGLFWYKPQRVGVAILIPLKDLEPETGVTEAGVTEAGVTEAGVTEAGVTEAGVTEAGETEAGETEAGETEAGETEAGETEAGEIEAGVTADEVLKALKNAQNVDWIYGKFISDPPQHVAPIRPDSETSKNDNTIMWAVISGATMFGAVHAVAWNFAFPSRVELIFWRCATIFTTAGPPGFFLLTWLHDMMEPVEQPKRLLDRLKEFVDSVALYSVGFIMLLYVAARLFIIVEMFRTLCFLPPGSYISTWTSNIPHVA